MLAPYVRNYVYQKTDSIQVAPPEEIEVPPLRVFTYIPVTRRVQARTIVPDATRNSKEDAAAAAKKSGSSTDPQTKPKPSGLGSIEGALKLKVGGVAVVFWILLSLLGCFAFWFRLRFHTLGLLCLDVRSNLEAI